MAHNQVQASGIIGNPWRVAGWGLVLAVLLAPMIAMRLTSEVNWGIEDFLFAGALLVGAGLVIELAVARISSRAVRLAIAALVVLAVLLIWAVAAVGILH